MDHLQQGWFTESDTWPGAGLSLQVEEVLHKEKSPYQDIMVLQTKSFGKALILDNIIQCTEFDEFSYQEMISFLPLCSHPNPERVLVVGGGDGGVARETVKHPKVLSVDVVEIDERVVKLSEQYLPFMACGFKHDKVTLHIEDGFEFMKNNAQRFDIIITDSSDPVGPNESLFQKTYIESLKRSLKPGGIICSQVGSIWIKEDQDTMIRLSKDCSANFKKVTLATISIPSYPTGNISFILATDNELVNFKIPAYSFTLEEMNKHKLKHYSPDVHSASFSIPRFARMIIPHINC
ncbi:spermidine synthase [Acyrthosiphon pisum]|uniref:Spermidine synthase n=1 Tax=Acyrthosiphon pisum TaxID=7029 RepID=A0A8R1W3L3_ACYPI|nr:spermidine synthase [Acyrthosiphon pisum]|eukprot:XP_001948433.1 PREDICTED: spermidine synthase [Acyrthosiphon pisum]